MTEQQGEVMIELLRQILDQVTALNEEVDIEASDECTHPEDMRISLGMTNGSPHWVCKSCRYEEIKRLES